jgi:YD repeat-containing protein
MKIHSALSGVLCASGCALLMTVLAVQRVLADGPETVPVLEFAVGLPGKQVKLNWAAEPGVRYHVEKSTILGSDGSPGGSGWARVAMIESTGPSVEWRDPQAVTERCFYRVTKPQAEVFSIEPPVLAVTGGALSVHGQCLPPGTVIELLDDSGSVVATLPLVEETAGRWRAAASGVFPPGGPLTARVVVPGGAPLGGAVPIEVTLSGFAKDAPASLPPAAPVPLFASNPVPGIGIVVKKGPNRDIKRLSSFTTINDDSNSIHLASKKGYDYYQALSDAAVIPIDDSDSAIAPNDDADFSSSQRALKKGDRIGLVGFSHSLRPSSSGIPGEVSFHFDALSIPCPAGPPLSWVMTYRSSVPLSSGHGPQWDFSYNISIEAQPAGSGSSAARIVVRDGGGRADVFHRQADGSYRCDGLFRQGSFAGDTFTLTFADQGKWVFKPLDGSPAAGRIASIMDRNNVALACDYDAATGMLSSVSDAFGRSLLVSWDPSSTTPRISSVADSTGRTVHFAAYASGETGGTEGTLKSISCVEIPGSPPEAAPFVFTYTTGQADPNLNDNLLSITDGAGRLLEAFTYHPTGDRRSVEYDRCASHDRRGGGHVTVLKSSSSSSGGYTIYQVDELGRLTETDCDKLHRVTSIRQFTGVCTPGTPADATTNRPTGKLRASDPDFFETQYAWNPDHALVQATDPDGSQLRFVHEREMKPGCPVIERGNVRSVTLRSASGETRTVSFDYHPGFGTLESAMPGGPIKGASVKCGRNPGGEIVGIAAAPSGGPGDEVDQDCDGLINPIAMDKGLRRWTGKTTPKDVFVLKNDVGQATDTLSKNPNRGISNIKVYDSNNNNFILRKEEGGRHTPFQNKYRPQFSSRGITINTSHIEYRTYDDCDDADPAFSVAKQTQAATFGVRKGGNGSEIGIDCGGVCSVMDLVSGSDGYIWQAGPIYVLSPRISRVITGHGQEISWTYDAHGNPSSCTTPVAGSGASYQYDTFGRCTSVSIADGASSFVTEFSYDPATGMPSSVVQDPGGLAITTQFEYDPLGRCIRSVDPGGFDTLYEYLPSGRLARCESPPVGSSRIATTFHYDQACLLVRCDVKNRNADGALHPSNSAYSTFFVYDSRARLVRIAEEERPVEVTGELTPDSLGIENFAVCDFTINDAGEITRVSTPAACRGSTEDLVCDYQFDERGLLYRCIQGGLGSTSSIVDQIDYSAAGLPVRTARLVSGSPVSELHCDYDGFHRLSTVTDPMGNVVHFSYDSRGGITTEVFGEVTDLPGSAGNVLLSRKKTQSSSGMKRQLGWLAVEDSLTLPNVGDVCYDIKVDPPSSASRSLFHGWETRDDIITEERFVAGSTAPPVIETTVITRSPAGLVKQVSRNGDLLATFTHDTAGRTLTRSNGASTTSVTRDTRGNIQVCGQTQHFRVGGAPSKTFTTTYQYDPLGRLVQSSDSSGNTTTQSYDSLGRLQTLVTALACTIHCDYDGSSTAGAYSQRVSADLDGDGSAEIVVSSLHRCGEWKSSTDPQGHLTTATHDSLGRLSRVDYPEGTYETFSYNARGLHHQGRLLDGTTCDIEHDLNGRPISVSLSGSPKGIVPVPPTVCVYDGLGRLVSCDQGTSQVSFAWDSLGSRVGETQGDVTVSSVHNHRGRSALYTSVQHPYQLHVSENRDSLGRVLAVSLVDATGATSAPVASFEYLGVHLSRIVSGNGVSTDYTYRGDGQAPAPGDHSFGLRPVRCVVTDSSGTVLSDSSVARNAGQFATSVSTRFSIDLSGPGRGIGLTCDSLGRVTGWTATRREGAGLPPVVENSVSHTLDSRGQRLQTSGGPYPGSYSQSPTLPPGDAQRGRYTTWPQGSLEWDENRNLTRVPYGDVTHTMLHDALGRLVSVTDDATGSPVAEFTYDALDRLVTLTVHGGSVPQFTRFIYDGGVCIQELGGDGVADLTHVVSGGIRHCISTRNGTIYYPHGISLAYIGPCDASSVITGATGAVIEHRACDGDGRPLYLGPDGQPSSTGRSVIPLRWKAPELLWIPETRLFHSSGGVFSPDLGMKVSKGGNGYSFNNAPSGIQIEIIATR